MLLPHTRSRSKRRQCRRPFSCIAAICQCQTKRMRRYSIRKVRPPCPPTACRRSGTNCARPHRTADIRACPRCWSSRSVCSSCCWRCSCSAARAHDGTDGTAAAYWRAERALAATSLITSIRRRISMRPATGTCCRWSCWTVPVPRYSTAKRRLRCGDERLPRWRAQRP